MAKINNILSFSIKFQNALDRNFEYDPLYRLISGDGRESNTQNQNDYLYSDAPAPGSPNANNVRAYTRKYAFDKLGNIQQLKQLGSNGFTRNFTYNAGHNTLQKIETATPSLLEDFTYDACGNQLTAGTTRNYVWNAGNQLVTYYNQVGSADPTIFAQYDYSGMNRVSKLVKTGTRANPIYERTIYIDGIFEYHILENGTTYEKNYVHIMDDQSRIAMVRIGTPFPDDIADTVVYNLEDQIGSNTIRLNNIGGIIDKEEYYPFGDSSFRTFTKKRYRYVGKEKDLESGLYYYGARYYAAWTCRFISVDPLASDYVHLTPYNNAGNKPINSIDIDGLQGAEEQKTSDTSTKSTTIANDPKIDLLPEVKVTGHKKLTGWEKFKAFGKGFIKGAAIAVVATVAIIAIAASAGTAAPFIIAGAAAYGAYQGVKTGYEIVSGKEAWTGNELGEEERWERGGELAGGIVGAKVGLKLKSKSNSSKTEIKEKSIVLEGTKGIRNSHLAGKVHPKTNVPFDQKGFPDFSGNLYKGGINDVIINPTGNRVADFSAANRAAGYSSTPKGYTWHHHQAIGRMQLVETGVHSQTGHTGGFTLWKY